MNKLDALALQVQTGDEQAFTVLYNNLYPKVLWKATRILKNHEDAEDAANDAFAKGYHNIADWVPERSKFTTWFYKVCHHQILDVYRSQERQKQKYPRHKDYEDDVPLEHLIAPSRPVAESLAIEEAMEQIEKILCEMPLTKRVQRLAWTLRRLEGYCEKDVAKIMGIPLATAKIGIYRCKLYIKSNLPEEYNGI